MVNLIMTPQRSNYKAEYNVENDVLTVSIDDVSETFDFTGLPEGIAESIIVNTLPINPIVQVEKIADTIHILLIRFYNETEKELFEEVL